MLLWKPHNPNINENWEHAGNWWDQTTNRQSVFQPGPGDPALLQGLDQRHSFHDVTAGGVDQDGTWFELSQSLCIDEVAGAGQQRHMQADNVRIRKQVLLTAIADAKCRFFIRRQTIAPEVLHIKPESERHRPKFARDLAASLIPAFTVETVERDCIRVRSVAP